MAKTNILFKKVCKQNFLNIKFTTIMVIIIKKLRSNGLENRAGYSFEI